MYTDKLLRVSDAQALGGVELSDNSIELTDALQLGRDMGDGEELIWCISITGANAGGATGLTIETVSATNEALTAGTTVHGGSGGIPQAQLLLGRIFYLKMMMRDFRGLLPKTQRYIGLRYTPDAAAAITGALFTADLVHTISNGGKAYRSGFTVIG